MRYNEVTMKNNETIVYSINVEDLQTVAKAELSRDLTPKELEIIGDKVGDYFDWYGAIAAAIKDHVENSLSEKANT